MAGFINWADLDFAAGTSVAKTVLETVWPLVEAEARHHQWAPNVYKERLTATLARVIVAYKARESPSLQQNEEAQAAILAGEIYAASENHRDVTRFENAGDAQTWILRNARLNIPTALNIRNDMFPVQGYDNILLDPTNVRARWNQISWRELIMYLYVLGGTKTCSKDLIQCLVNYVCGICKMGTTSNEWRKSRIAQIRREVNMPDLEMEQRVIEHVWDFYGVAFAPTAEAYGPFFLWLEGKCRDKNLTRLFITAKQSANQGSTVIELIAQAMREFPDFHWERFDNPRVPAERVISAEKALWVEDLAALRDNPWIRFGGAAGRTPQMANLGYLAKTLMVKAGGFTSYQNYGGLEYGNLTIRYKAWIDNVVGQYITAVQEEVPADRQHPVLRPDGVAQNRPAHLAAGVHQIQARAELQVPPRMDAAEPVLPAQQANNAANVGNVPPAAGIVPPAGPLNPENNA